MNTKNKLLQKRWMFLQQQFNRLDNELIKVTELKNMFEHTTLSQCWFLIGIGMGFVLNLTASIIDNQAKSISPDFYRIYAIITLIITFIFLVGITLYIHHFYVRPLDYVSRKLNKVLKDYNNIKGEYNILKPDVKRHLSNAK